MIKSLFAIALLSGSLGVFADDINQYNDTTATYPEHYNTGTSDTLPADSSYTDETSSSMSSTRTTEPTVNSDQYSDTTSSSMSATGREDTSGSQYNSGNQYNSSSSTGTMNADNTVTGTMGPGETLGERYNKLHVGLLGGVNSPSDNDVDASSEIGLDIGYQPNTTWGVGVEASTTELDRADQARRTMGLLKASTRFGGDIPFVKDIFVGAGVGPVVTGSKWRVGAGPLAGFDIPLTSNRSHDFLTLGANAKYIWTTESPDSLISAIALKYWF